MPKQQVWMVTVPGKLEHRVPLSTVSSKLGSAPNLDIHLDPSDSGPNRIEGIGGGGSGKVAVNNHDHDQLKLFRGGEWGRRD